MFLQDFCFFVIALANTHLVNFQALPCTPKLFQPRLPPQSFLLLFPLSACEQLTLHSLVLVTVSMTPLHASVLCWARPHAVALTSCPRTALRSFLAGLASAVRKTPCSDTTCLCQPGSPGSAVCCGLWHHPSHLPKATPSKGLRVWSGLRKWKASDSFVRNVWGVEIYMYCP